MYTRLIDYSIMFVIQLVVFSIHLHRHRMNRVAPSAPPGYTAGNDAISIPLGKVEHQVTTRSIADPYSPNQLPVAQPQPAQPVGFSPQLPQFAQPAAVYPWQGASPVANKSEQHFQGSPTAVPLNTQHGAASIQTSSMSELGGPNIPLGGTGNAAELTGHSKATYR